MAKRTPPSARQTIKFVSDQPIFYIFFNPMKLLKTSFLLAAAVAITASHAQPAPSVGIGSGTLEDLGTLGLPSNIYSVGLGALSADGSTLIGNPYSMSGSNQAYRWTAAGRTDLGTLGGNYSSAYAVSANGSVVVGSSTNGIGDTHAFRWTTAGGMSDLGTLGGNYSEARALSADGIVVAGESLDLSGNFHAFRWTVAGGITDLGTLGGNSSDVRGLSADGSVVVGTAGTASYTHAFRWTAASGMTDLGTLGGNYSWATRVSADGSAVIGDSHDINNLSRAFRWTAASGMTDLGTLGGNYSWAAAISADGSVVVGYSYNASIQVSAFRWTTAGGMTDLGDLGGAYSEAVALSADGSVVVGGSNLANGDYHAFRWTATDGMSDLGTLGGTFSVARAVSADGSVITGESQVANGDTHVFMYRGGRALLDVDEWLASVGGNSRIYHDGTTLAGLPLEGAHHRPMLSFDRMGKESQAWATGDFGSSARTRDVHVSTGEAGINWNLGKTSLIGFAAGHGIQNADLAYEGSSSTKGDYALVEYDYRPEGTQWIVSLLGMIGSWESKTNRGYITGTGPDFSAGVTDIITRSARLRVDAPTLVTFGGFGFAPYASYTVTQTIVSAYAETGGSFAAAFEEQSHNATEGRVGVTAAKDLSADTKLLLTVEAIHRFDGAGPALIGQEVIGGIAFNQAGTAPRADCVRFGFDVDHKLNENTLLNISAHASTVGEAHDVSAAISIRRAF